MKRSLHFALAAFLASCLGPPAVTPNQTLSIDHALGGPRTRGAYAVVFAGPRGTVTNRSEPGITVLFNRAMRTLEQDENARIPAIVVRTDEGVDIAGKWRWIGTHGVFFAPDKPLPGSTHVKVTVPRGTPSLEGEALASDYSFTFTTERPRVSWTLPGEGATTLRPDSSIRVEMNQPIDPAELEKSGRLLVRAEGDAKVKLVPFSAAHATDGKHPELALVVTPKQRLPLDAAVELDIAKGLKGEGPLKMEEAEHLHMRTYGPLRLARVTCPRVFDTTLGKCQAHRDITVALSNDVMPDEFRSHVAFGKLPKAPLLKPTTTLHTPRPKPQNAFALGADPDFEKRYRVTLKAGMTDVYGQRLAKDLVFDVDTEPPFSHQVAPAPRPEPRTDTTEPPPESVASRPIPPFEVGFGLSGYVLEAATRTHAVPVGLVNVPTYGLITRKLDPRETKQWLAGIATSPSGFMSAGYRFSWETPDPAANVRIVRSVDLDQLLAPTHRGTALLALGTPAQTAPLREQVVSLTDLAITAKMSKFGSLVWVTSLSTGKPVGGAQIAIGLLKKDDQRTFVTDDSGVALVPPDAFAPIKETRSSGWGGDYATPDADWVIVASKGDDWTYQRVEESPSFLRAAPNVDLAASKEWQGTVFADRGVYRPGETVKLAAVLRQADARGLSVVGGRDVRVTVDDGQGDKVFESRAKLDAFGGLAIDAPLPKTAHLGSATATLTLASSRSSFTTSFLVADFKPVEFAVTAGADNHDLVRGDRAHFTVHGEYLFHAPMAEAATHDSAVRSVTSFSPKGSDGFITTDEAFTSDYGDKSPRAGELLEQDAALDASGDHDAWVALPMPGQTQPELVTFESDVEDFTRQVVAGSTSVLVHPAEYYVGLKRPESRFVAIGATLRPDVLAFKPDGGHVTGAGVKLELVERKWTTVVEDQGDGSRRSKVEDTVVAACDVTTAERPAACALRVPEAGYFIVRATSKDRRGNTVRASTSLYSLSDKPDVQTHIGWSEGDARIVKLEADKNSYEPGETAKILVRNPFKDAEALVTVERGGVLASQTTVLHGSMPVVSVPIQDDYFPNVFVSIHLVRGRLAPAPATGADISGPEYREGYVELGISPHTHRLDVDVKADAKEHRPGDPIDADVTVKDARGQPVRAELTFYAVDEGVLMLTGYQTPDPLGAFTKPRSLAVFGMESRDHLGKILALKAGEKLRNLGWETRGNGEDKGDDGGGGGEDSGGKPRHDFKNTAYFEAGRITSDDGKAHFHFVLPDNLTTFRLMAVAASTDRFGSGQTSIVSSKKLMARPALPRAMRVGDKLDASVVISGKKLGAVPVDVRIATTGGVRVSGSAVQHVTLPASGNLEVHFPIVAEGAGDSSIRFSVSGGGEKDSVEVKKHVELPLHLESTAVFGETNRAAAIALGDLSKIRGDQGALDVRVSSSALVGLSETFEQLDQYPYGCTEQLASRMIPLLSLDDLARSVGVRVPAATDTRMQDAAAELVAHQHESGGFGYWTNDDEEPWLSAYALLALDSASKHGFYVPHDVLDNGVSYLRRALAKQKFKESDDDDKTEDAQEEDTSSQADALSAEDKQSLAYAEATFIADTLATLGKPDPGYLNQLYDARAHQALFTQALLLHAMAVGAMPKSQTAMLASEIQSRLRIDADAAYAEEQGSLYAPLLDSPARTTALVLRALLAIDPKHPIAARLAKGLLSMRKSGAWESTQEDSWALVALDAYRKNQEGDRPDFDVSVFLGSSRIGEESFHDRSLKDDRFTLVPSRVRASGGPLTFAMNGTGKLFYSAELKYEIADLPKKPMDRGLFVQKTMRAVKLADLAEATDWIPKTTTLSAQAGDLVVVDVLLESAEPEEQVVIEDPLPAGLEAIDFDFATTGQNHAVSDRVRTDVKPPRDAVDVGMPFRETTYHREMKDDRVLTFVPHVLPGMYHFRYLARATAVGTYVMPPTSASCMYTPDIFGRTAASSFEVRR
ncbi:MAG TPA: MG2 domain-containing protein [Polyangiaceae bacterium]|jgi:hypothetical protein